MKERLKALAFGALTGLLICATATGFVVASAPEEARHWVSRLRRRPKPRFIEVGKQQIPLTLNSDGTFSASLPTGETVSAPSLDGLQRVLITLLTSTPA